MKKRGALMLLWMLASLPAQALQVGDIPPDLLGVDSPAARSASAITAARSWSPHSGRAGVRPA